jgi:6-phosphofructokinase
VSGTQRSFGFDTAVSTATEALDKLHSTAESHDRVLVVEVMGRHVGHIAVWAGLAGGATITLVPEEPFDLQDVSERIVARHQHGKWATIIVVAEGALPKPGTVEVREPPIDSYGHQVLGGIGHLVAAEVHDRTGIESRTTVLGHVQRGGSPVAFDRVLGSRFGIAAVDAVADRALGQMVALQSGEIVRIPVADAVGHLKVVSPALLRDGALFHPPHPR